MVALAFAALYPRSVERLIVLNAAHESHAFATAWRSLQRRVIDLGLANGCAAEALAIARGMGMLSYRTAEEFEERFEVVPARDGDAVRFPCEGYLAARGEDFARRFDPEVVRTLSLAIDLHRVEPEKITTPVTLIGALSDWLVPPEQLQELVDRLAGPVSAHLLDTIYGHDAFLKEAAGIGPLLRGALEVSS
jgi:homoserine O-acetyltransferase